MSTIVLMIGGVICAVGSFIIPAKLQERQIDDAVNKKFNEYEKKKK